MSKPVTVLHHNDADGFGAAYALWTKYGDNANYIPVQYGQPVPEIPDGTKFLFIVDFSYDEVTCADLIEKYETVIIDHHKTAQAEIGHLPNAIFDTNKSGAVLTWGFANGKVPIPELLLYVQDRDLWQWRLPNSEEVNLAIASLPWDFEVWDNFDLDAAISSGTAIKPFRDGQLAHLMKNVVLRPFAGYNNIPTCNTCLLQSEFGQTMCEAFPGAPFSVSYSDRPDNVRSYSLSSIGEFDVSEVAKRFEAEGIATLQDSLR